DVSLPNQIGIQSKTISSLHKAIKRIGNYEQVKQNPSSLYDYCQWENDVYSYNQILHLCNEISLPSPPKIISLPRDIKLKKQKRKFSLLEEEIKLFYNKLDQIEQQSFERTIEYVAPNVYSIHANQV